MGSHQSSQVCRVVPGLSTPSPFTASHGTERQEKAPGSGLSGVMEGPPRAPRSAQEVRSRPGRSRSLWFAGARRADGNGGSRRLSSEGLPGCSGLGREGLQAARGRVCASLAGSPAGERGAQGLIPRAREGRARPGTPESEGSGVPD